MSQYLDFVNLKYKPKKNDIICLFRIEPAKGISMKEAIARVASESSSGTWTKLTQEPKLLSKVKAYAFHCDKEYVKVAYPRIIAENGSVPGLMSGIGGNIFGMKAVKNLKLVDAEFPLDYVKYFKGAVYGREAIKRIFKRKNGPITSVVPKPKLGYTAREHAEKVAYPLWKGGIDCCKDDENLVDLKFNKFEDRVKFLSKFRDKAEKETGDVKDAFINVTSPDLKELERRIKIIHNHDFKYFMLDVVVSGFTAVGTACELARDYKMAIHGHRAMHAMFTKNPRHGMSMLFLSKLLRLIGIDQIHTGTVIGKLEGNEKEIIAMKEMLTKQEVSEIKNLRLKQNWGKIKAVLPVSSGGLHPGILPLVFDIYGTMDIVLQIGGGTQGHPAGIEAGAKAVIQSIEAYKLGIDLREYAKTHKELKQALDKWGFKGPV